MNLKFCIDQLIQNKEIFYILFSDVDSDFRVWKQNSEKWSLLEILCHLYDEEREDFRQRFQHILESPENDPPAINPQAWVLERNYLIQDFEHKLESFMHERDHSIAYLQSLDNIPWENTHDHQHFGPITAKHYLYNWLAHDYLHIKQITKLKYDYLVSKSDQDMTYAGEWK